MSVYICTYECVSVSMRVYIRTYMCVRQGGGRRMDVCVDIRTYMCSMCACVYVHV